METKETQGKVRIWRRWVDGNNETKPTEQWRKWQKENHFKTIYQNCILTMSGRFVLIGFVYLNVKLHSCTPASAVNNCANLSDPKRRKTLLGSEISWVTWKLNKTGFLINNLTHWNSNRSSISTIKNNLLTPQRQSFCIDEIKCT